MIKDYPNYYKDFHCIAGDCTETCCAGWEVDLDEDALYYYQEIAPAPFGDVIRSHIKETPEGDYIFPLRDNGRCPFLNEDNLCDIIINLGESRICRTCTEHPRFVVEVADYLQHDLSLSCPEAARLFFQDDLTFAVMREETETPAYLTESYLDDEEFVTCLDCRDHCLAILGDHSLALPERLAEMERYVLGGHTLPHETPEQLLSLLRDVDKLDDRWEHHMQAMRSSLAHYMDEACRKEYLAENASILERNFEKLSMYLAFRYFPDAYYDGSPIYGLRMVLRSMQLLSLLCFARWEETKSPLTNEDFKVACHAYSKEVEHDDVNILAMKGL